MRLLSEYSQAPDKIRAEIYVMKGDLVCLAYMDEERFKTYMMPGGKVEKGEEIIDAAKRECLEEVGIKVKNIRFIEKNRYNLPKFLYEIHSYVADYDGEDNSLLGDGPEGKLKFDFVPLEEAYKKLEVVSRSNRKGMKIAFNSLKIIKYLIDEREKKHTPRRLKLTKEQWEAAFKRAKENSKKRVKWIDKR